MKKSIQDRREQKNALAKEARNMLANAGDKAWTKDEQAAYDAKIAEIELVNGMITRMEAQMTADAENAFNDVDDFKLKPTALALLNGESAEVAIRKAELRAGFDLYLRNSMAQMTPEQMQRVRNTMSTTTPAQGGYTVQTLVASDFIETLKAYGFMRAVATQFATATGVDMSYPTTDGTTEMGEWVAQNASATPLDPTFGTVALNVFKAGSKIITIPIELLQDTSIDIVSLIYARMRDRIGRIANLGYTVGTGTGQPFGLSTQAPVGKVGTTGQTLTVTYDDLVDLVDSLDPAYLADTPSIPAFAGASSVFMFNQTMRRTIRKIKDTAGRPIWTPSYDEGMSAKRPDFLLGYPVSINNDMPVPAANAKTIAFGNTHRYVIRDSMEVTMFRFEDSAYASKGQVGFLAWARTGGNLMDVQSVKQYQHSAT